MMLLTLCVLCATAVLVSLPLASPWLLQALVGVSILMVALNLYVVISYSEDNELDN
ncbi:hypothetical protein [Ferrimonas pelagia]|uniref:Uncharacterized protein n=1 Tax=Ferrimonas pelagia TaxID=1177826 RepID=A0ABP9E9I5_9GAMM